MKISIFTPSHDTRYLEEAYVSIRDQPFDEWVILLNGEADRVSSKILGDLRVRVAHAAPEIHGVGALKAAACDLCTGGILLELDHDDMLLPGVVWQVSEVFQSFPEVGFVYTNSVYMNADGSAPAAYSEQFGWSYRPYVFRGRELQEYLSFPPSPEAVSRIWYAPNHLRAFRREAYQTAGGYDRNLTILDDQDLMCRLYQVTQFMHLSIPGYLYRVHDKNTWLEPQTNKAIQDGVWPIYHRHIHGMLEGVSAPQGLDRIEIGGRMNARKGYTTVDLRGPADIIADLNGRWPFEDSSAWVIRAFDVLEHLKSPIHAMKEISRVLAPGGWLVGQVPSTEGRGAFQDPTHVSFWNENSFLYYTNASWAKYIDTPARFQAVNLYTTAKDDRDVCWTRFHLVNLKGGYRPPGLVEI